MSSLNRRQFIQTCATAALSSVAVASTSALADEPLKPKRRILAIGGGGTRASDRDRLMLKYIISLTGKKDPLVCLLPTASADNPESIVTWYENTNDLECRARHMRLINNSTNLKSLEKQLLSMDAFYVGGGNTLNMLAIWKAQGVDTILRKAWEQGTVMAGSSAGMICWFEQGVSDSLPERLSSVESLGFLKGSVCPHYNHRDRDGRRDRQESFHRLLLAGDIKDGIACDDGAALLYEDDKLVRIVGENPFARACCVRRDGQKVIEDPQAVEFLGKKF